MNVTLKSIRYLTPTRRLLLYRASHLPLSSHGAICASNGTLPFLLRSPAKQLGRQVAILPQDELAAFRSIPALCLNSGSDGLCSARDFHNNKVCICTVVGDDLGRLRLQRQLPLLVSTGLLWARPSNS